MTVSFNPVKNFKVGNAPNVVSIADFNGDGKEDLVATSVGSKELFLQGC